MDDQLQQLIELQKKQNQLLEKYLWRFRFSLLALLLLTTITCVGLGVLVYGTQPSTTAATTAAPTLRLSGGDTLSIQPIQAGDRVNPQTELFQLETRPFSITPTE